MPAAELTIIYGAARMVLFLIEPAAVTEDICCLIPAQSEFVFGVFIHERAILNHPMPPLALYGARESAEERSAIQVS